MIILQAKGITKSFGTEKVLDNVSFIINEGEKVGLVGPNGTGKTTLLRCLTGEEQADSGEITLGHKYTMGYLEQFPDYSIGTTLMDCVLDSFEDIFKMREELRLLEKEMGKRSDGELEKLLERYSLLTHKYEEAGGFSCEATARKVIKGLGFSDEDLIRDVNTFSGGEKTRAGLARLLVREPDLLLLDEPTNHLALQALEWLESFLKNYRGALLLISHDRYFLDEVVDRVLELENKQIKSFPGNYSKYLVLKKEQELAQARAYEKQQQEIAKIEAYILKYKAGIKARQARGRASQLARMERMEKVQEKARIRLAAGSVEDTGDIVLEALNLQMAYQGVKLFDHLNFTIYKREKVALIGGNGTGKSTILKIITGEIEPVGGSIRLGSRVKIGYFDQEHRNLDKEKRVIDEIMDSYGFNEGQARNKLAQVLFQGDDVYKKICDLSGGEKARLSFLKIILDEPNFLLLDEPTNHLDISSQEVVETFLEGFSGTILLVSHDRFLLDKVTERTLELERGQLHNYLGSYSYYKEKKEELLRAVEEKNKREVKRTVAVRETPKINKAKLRNEIASLEEEISILEEQKERLSEELANPMTYQDEQKSKEMIAGFKRIEEELPKMYEKWEELCTLLEQ
ncbi:MAG: ABC-F family ATP-binding cassette domain-containing protein [Clostridia bacterium]|nr:ABC-F family ATP-binding cassette domain-containing protein [Clostridia bacterium]